MGKITKQKIISRVKKGTGITIDMFRQTSSWVLVYDDPENNIYETEVVYVMWLADMTLDQWVSTAEEFAIKSTNKAKGA